jgi:2-polyprenyl-3-methyl-5-hydroxy-6-metoxy-1,4-benzoquinol methylase
MPCALCGKPSLTTVSSVDAKSHDPLNVAICNECGLVQQDPLCSEEELRHFYSHHYRTDYKKTYTPQSKHIYRAGMTAIDRVNFLKANGIQGGKLLDVGAGGGEFVYISRAKGYDAIGIEPNIGYSEFARAQYGVEIKTGEFCEITGRYQIITMFHALEHMPHPIETFAMLWSLLNEGGYLFIEVPNIETNEASPHNIFFKAHLFYFSQVTLAACASPYFEPLIIDGRANLRILFKRKHQKTNISLPKRDDVLYAIQRLRRKGWVEYLFAGGGIFKLFFKLKNIIIESKSKNKSSRDILNKILECH